MNKLALSALIVSLTACQPDTRNLEKKVDDLAKNQQKILDLLAKGGGGAGAANARQQQPQRDEADPNAMFAVDVSQNIKKGMIEGPATAPVTVVEAWDLACPYCQRVSDTMQQLVKDYNGKLRVVFKNLVVHPQIVARAHLAGCAAALQGKFVPFYHAWWDKAYKPYQEARDPSKMSEEAFMAWVPTLGLDATKLKADMDGPECKALIDADSNELRKFRVGSTPSFFINGSYIAGALDAAAFKNIIDQKLKIAEASGAGADYYEKEVMVKGEKQFKAAAQK